MISLSRLWRIVAAALGALAVVAALLVGVCRGVRACRQGSAPTLGWLTELCRLSGVCPEPPQPHDLVVDWLTCIDCPDGQLDSVLALAMRNFVPTVQVLAGHLLEGPGDARLSAFDEASRRVQRANVEYALRRGEPPPLPIAAFVARYHVRFERSWRTRAAMALGAIRVLPHLATLDAANGFLATSALDSATRLGTLDSLVRKKAAYALDSVEARSVPQRLIPVR